MSKTTQLTQVPSPPNEPNYSKILRLSVSCTSALDITSSQGVSHLRLENAEIFRYLSEPEGFDSPKLK